mmetsp:Transcript_27925/g.32197  ORF Transcript_27925/g.32197 Transcript_27925/m.32197 type:complete len:95 (-) Transcript_27925:138-422(-)
MQWLEEQCRDLGGAVLGFCVSLFWTGQGRLILDYASLSKGGVGSGSILVTFWGVFQCSSLVRGCISFAYYSTSKLGSGLIALYSIFLSIITLGA